MLSVGTACLGMIPLMLSMRWWLALAFAAVAATTAIAVAEVSSRRSEAALTERAQELAAGNAFAAAIELRDWPLEEIAERRRLALFLFDREGDLLSAPRSRGVRLEEIADAKSSVAEVLTGRRAVTTDESAQATLVGLPFVQDGAGVLLAYQSHPEVAADVGIVHDEITRAAWIALVVGGLVGVVIASLIALRVQRITKAAAAIEAGDLETALRRDFPDEVGALATTFDRMRLRLRSSFATLEAERDRLERLLERLQEGVVAVDAELVVHFANGAARELVPTLEPGEQLPEPWNGVELRAFARSLFEQERVRDLRARPGELVLAIDGVPAAADELAILVLRDLTEEERRERAEREFVANASHELRTPLTTLLGAVEALQGGAKEEPETRDRFLAHVEREVQKLVRLTQALLVLARAQSSGDGPRLRPVPLRPLLDGVAASLRPRRGVVARVECDPTLAVSGEPELLEQALVNLARNAVEHTRAGEIVLAAHANGGGKVAIEVRDSGTGIPEGVHERIFDRFFRPDPTNGAGFGLGLAIVRQAVRAQLGEVAVAGRPGGGTTFTIELPRVEA
jgi:signal transduction histidine kinase/HAMP domain-containing protein